jgi:hypothetical protein
MGFIRKHSAFTGDYVEGGENAIPDFALGFRG